MSRCYKIIKAYIQDGAEGCGIPKTQIRLLDKYVPFIQDLAKEYEIDEDLLFQNVQASAVRPVLRFNKNNPLRVNVEKHIIDTIKSKKSPTKKTIELVMGITPKPKLISDHPESIKERTNIKTQQIYQTAKSSSDISEKIRIFKSILTSGQIQIWKDYAMRHNLDDEYSALSEVTKRIRDM